MVLFDFCGVENDQITEERNCAFVTDWIDSKLNDPHGGGTVGKVQFGVSLLNICIYWKPTLIQWFSNCGSCHTGSTCATSTIATVFIFIYDNLIYSSVMCLNRCFSDLDVVYTHLWLHLDPFYTRSLFRTGAYSFYSLS